MEVRCHTRVFFLKEKKRKGKKTNGMKQLYQVQEDKWHEATLSGYLPTELGDVSTKRLKNKWV